tara:strand:+ start:7321 stop:7878 length:558 start_codon:yes stop_codon:yes gene_type:complete
MSKKDRIIEALLFASPEPLTQKKISYIFDRDIPDLKLSIERLNSFYSKNNQSIEIINVAGGYQLRTKQEFSIFIKKLFNNNFQNSISQAALESLSIIAYKQPVSKSSIESIRGVDCSGVVKTLLKKSLIQIKGRDNGPGRALLYITSKEFLISFGIDKLSDLPKLKEINEIIGENNFDKQINAFK